MRVWSKTLLVCCLTAALSAAMQAQSADVTVRVMPANAAGAPVTLPDSSSIVVWLSPVQPGASSSESPVTPRKTYRMVQKNKQFSPHLLVVPVGSEVSFPNLDPFFHNVFSLFNGRRFDLGLYETGSQRSVLFPREGVSYIFCNIHPEMGAVIISLATPYYVVGRPGVLRVPHVPVGDYVLHVWSEDALPLSLSESARSIAVKAGSSNSAELKFAVQAHPPGAHLNKYGEPYSPSPAPIY